MTNKLFGARGEPLTAGTELAGLDIKAGRRAFMQSVGLGMAGTALLGATGVTPAAAQTVSDADILNFALNLEYLEAEFYLRAAFGRGLADSDVTGGSAAPQPNNLGAVQGGRQVNFATPAIKNYAAEIATEEELHVKFLRSQLGQSRVARPAINIGSAFTAAAQAAGLGSGFDAYANENNFLLAAFIFEDVGVSAYLGAAPLVTNKTILAGAGGILAAEAYHAGTIRTVLYSRNLQIQAQAISNLRDNVDNTAPLGTFGSTEDDQGIGTANTANTSLTDPSTGLAYPRTTTNVLNIVYLNANTTPGGFFPSGLNGNIRGTSSASNAR